MTEPLDQATRFNRLRDSQGVPDDDGHIEVGFRELCDVLALAPDEPIALDQATLEAVARIELAIKWSSYGQALITTADLRTILDALQPKADGANQT